MTSPLHMQYALMCLQELDRRGSEGLEQWSLAGQSTAPREAVGAGRVLEEAAEGDGFGQHLVRG